MTVPMAAHVSLEANETAETGSCSGLGEICQAQRQTVGDPFVVTMMTVRHRLHRPISDHP